MSTEWIESRLREAPVPPSGEGRERTVALARAIAPQPRRPWHARLARPRVLVPAAVLAIAAMSAPGQAATKEAANFVSDIVPLRSHAVVISTPGRGGSVGLIMRAGRGHDPSEPFGAERPNAHFRDNPSMHPASRAEARAATRHSLARLRASLRDIPADRRPTFRVGPSGRIQVLNARPRHAQQR
jgi:hypothetical protein